MNPRMEQLLLNTGVYITVLALSCVTAFGVGLTIGLAWMLF